MRRVTSIRTLGRITALTVMVAGLACGDSTAPESDLAPGRGTVTSSGDVTASDSMLAAAGLGPSATNPFIILTPVVSRVPVDTGRSSLNGVFLPISVVLSVTARSDSVLGLHRLGAGVTASILDSIGLISTGPPVQDSTFPINVPSYDALLQGSSGTITIDRADTIAVMGSFAITARSKTGRVVNATGRFHAKVLPLPAGGIDTTFGLHVAVPPPAAPR